MFKVKLHQNDKPNKTPSMFGLPSEKSLRSALHELQTTRDKSSKTKLIKSFDVWFNDVRSVIQKRHESKVENNNILTVTKKDINLIFEDLTQGDIFILEVLLMESVTALHYETLINFNDVL